MKIRQFIGLSLVAISSGFLLNSCGDETTNPAPAIDMISENGSVVGDVTMDGDKAFDLVFNVSDDSKVKSVEITSTYSGRVSPQLDSTINAKSLKIKITRRSLAKIATEIWTITATDDKGESSSKSFTITTTTEASGNPLTSYEKDNNNNPFKVWNFHGPNTGAFDLLDGSSKTKNDADADKDIHDSTGGQEISQWPGRWVAKNATRFKKVTSYSYDDVKNSGQLDAAWNASGSEMRFMLVKKGELYVAKLRGTNQKVLVYIVDVVKTSGDNLDYVQFNFKKE